MVKPKFNELATLLDLEKDMARHKKYKIAEVLKEMKAWVKEYDDHPIEFWNYRWDYLKRRLHVFSDMEKELNELRWRIIKEGKE